MKLTKVTDEDCQRFFNPDAKIDRKVLSSTKVVYFGTGKDTEGNHCPVCVLYILHDGTMHYVAFNRPYVLEQFQNMTGSVH